MSKRTDSHGLGSLGSGAITAASTLVVALVAAIVGVIVAREFGRTDETDGFFAAYGVFIVLVIAAQAIRVAVLPALAHAREERRLAGEVAGFGLALAVISLPLVLVTEVWARPLAALLTGDGSEVARGTAADVLRWVVPAAIAHLFAALAASGLAALDDYGIAALAYAAGSVSGLTLILMRVDADGIDAVAWGMFVNGAGVLAITLGGLALHAIRARMPRGAVRRAGAPLGARLRVFAVGASLPLALQMLYLVCLPFAGRQGTGAATSFVYAYLAASTLVTVTAGSLALVTAVPLSRVDLRAAGAARHVVAASWLALTLIAGAAGVLAVAGSDLVEAVLGRSYAGDVGTELSRVVVVLSLWMTASVGVSVTFPLTFVAGRTRLLPLIALGALALQIPMAWAGGRLLDLDGLALALAVATWLVVAAMLIELGALGLALRGLLVVTGVLTAIAVGSFVPVGLIFRPEVAATLGLAVYALLLGVLRPRGLRLAWSYLRALS